MDEQGERPTQGSTFGQTKVLFPRGRVSKQDSPFRTRSSCLAPPARAPRVPILDVYHHDIMYLICQHPELDSNRHQKQYAGAPPAASVALSVRLAGVPRAVALHLPHGAAAARHGAHARGVATQRNRRAAREALAVVPLRRRCVPPPSRARAASLSPRSSRATATRRSVTVRHVPCQMMHVRAPRAWSLTRPSRVRTGGLCTAQPPSGTVPRHSVICRFGCGVGAVEREYADEG
jgi:hypothetical protein